MSRGGVMEGIVFKQLYSELCKQLFPRIPISKHEQLAHEMWLKHSVNNGSWFGHEVVA